MVMLKAVQFKVCTTSGDRYTLEVRNVIATEEKEAVCIALGEVSSFFYETYHKIYAWDILEEYGECNWYMDMLNQDVEGFTDGIGFLSAYKRRKKYVRIPEADDGKDRSLLPR